MVSFFKWKSFDPTQARREMNEKIGDSVIRWNQIYSSAIQELIKKWRKGFNDGLMRKIADFNPTLRKLNDEIRRCENEIKELQNTQNK